jgi:hypothetical protein
MRGCILKIYIDESGLFAKLNENDNPDKGWATVGALAIPSKSEIKVHNALVELKKACGIKPYKELKNRPDSKNIAFVNFITKLKELECTLHAIVVNRQELNDSKTQAIKEKEIAAREAYCIKMAAVNSEEEQRILLEVFNAQKQNLLSISHEEFNQVKIQAHLSTYMLNRIICFYAMKCPEELSSISFVLDQKNASFEDFYKIYLPPIVEVELSKKPETLLHGLNYSYFFDTYGYNPSSEEIENDRKRKELLFDIDYSRISDHIAGQYQILKIYEDLRFMDSIKSSGLQTADLLISGINRCLRGNCTDNIEQASLLGSLTLNSCSDDIPNIPCINLYDSDKGTYDISFDILNVLNKHSFKLYNDNIRKNFKENMDKIVERMRKNHDVHSSQR